ncbi:MAG: dipeptidase [Gemmatimonadales bacterium]
MRRSISLAVAGLISIPAVVHAQADDRYMALAKRVLSTTPLVDGHNDLPGRIREDRDTPRDVVGYDLRGHAAGMTDLDRLAKGMVGGQFWSVYVPGELSAGWARYQLEEIDIAKRVIERYPDRLQLCTTALCVRQAFAAGKIGSLLGMEGGHAIENSLGALRAYFDLGARYMTLTHNVTLDWADAALDRAKHGGLTDFGVEVVREMNRLGMLVDLSHVSPATMSDALTATEAPVIFSHSGARELTDHPRNVPDSILRRLPANGGVVMVTFVTVFASEARRLHDEARGVERTALRQRFRNDSAAVSRGLAEWDRAHPAPRVTIKDVADHIDHVRQVAGVDNVGIGSDFDGIEDVIDGLEDVSTFPALFAELARRGWTEADLRKLAGENVLRAMEQAEKVAARLQKERPASTRTIEDFPGRPVP